MRRNWNGSFISLPLYDPNDGVGLGGDSGNSAGDFNSSDTPAEPQVIDIPDENALIRVKGSDKPVKYGEHVRGFQSQFTKASQRAAALERELQAERQQRQRYEQERQQAQRQTQQGGGQNDVYGQLEQLAYLSGPDAVGVLRHIESSISQRDRIILGMAQQMKAMQDRLGGLYETHTNNSFESKIGKILQDNGLDPQAYGDIAKEIYLAYEGDDLDAEFPRIFTDRINQLRRAFEAEKAAAVARNRQNRFVPGKGGVAGPSKPLQLKANASAAEIADQLWDSMQDGSGT
jgi:hypothetical protein